MIDEELQFRAIEALRIAAALIMQDAVETATRKLPAGYGPRVSVAEEIALAGRDVTALAEACRVLVRRTGPTD